MQSRFFAAGADFYSAAFGEGRPLEIGVFSGFSGRIKLGGTNTVGVFSSHKGRFIANET
jgi:hypothetical protein